MAQRGGSCPVAHGASGSSSARSLQSRSGGFSSGQGSSEACGSDDMAVMKDDPTPQQIVFYLTFFVSPLGCIAYCFNRQLPRHSLRYRWAYRAMRLGAALTVLYSFLLCSLLHHFRLQTVEGDIAGYSYPQSSA